MSRFGNLASSKNLIVCFICDRKVEGDRVNLATSLSSHSKVTLPEKISQLVGDDYVVAITEADCICKKCHSLVNHMDKLENELTLVKRALTTNISQKYKFSFDNTPAPVPQQPISNGLKTDSTSDYEDDTRKSNADVSAANAALIKRKIAPPAKLTPTPKLAKPAENLTKLKIYKCGFCSYQSKELGNVRLHMKIHIRANKSEADGDKTSSATAASPLVTPKPAARVQKRVFRCQVCSASFDDRNKCLEHISRDHTAAGRKLVEQKQNQAEQQSQSTTIADASSDSTSRVNAPDSEQPATTVEATVTTATAETTEHDETTTQKEGFEGLNNQEEMDTSEPPSIALYSCDSCPSNFNNDVEFANHANDHTESKDEEMPAAETKETTEESEPAKTAEENEFTEIPEEAETQAVNEDGTPKEPNFGMDIEAMIAALHSEGPEANTESMPNI